MNPKPHQVSNATSGKTNFHSRAEIMQAFDSLPLDVRRAICNANTGYDPIEVKQNMARMAMTPHPLDVPKTLMANDAFRHLFSVAKGKTGIAPPEPGRYAKVMDQVRPFLDKAIAALKQGEDT